MKSIALPSPIDSLVEAINGGDTERLMNLFAPAAIVNDWGSEYVGEAAIRAWNDRELIGAKGVLTVTGAEQRGDTIVLDTDWQSSFFSGPGRFTFKLDRGKIAHWQISAP